MELSALIGGGALFVLTILIFIFKEIIKSLVEKIIGSPKYGIPVAFVIAILLSGLIFYVAGFIKLDDENRITNEPIQEDIIELNPIDEAIKLLGLTGELIKDGQEEKRIKDSVFESERGHWWVYKLGEKANEIKLLKKTYEKFSGIGEINIFKKEKKNFFLFLYGHKDSVALADSLGRFQSEYSSLEIVDLEKYSTRKKSIKKYDDIKLKLSTGKVWVPCYEGSK